MKNPGRYRHGRPDGFAAFAVFAVTVWVCWIGFLAFLGYELVSWIVTK